MKQAILISLISLMLSVPVTAMAGNTHVYVTTGYRDHGHHHCYPQRYARPPIRFFVPYRPVTWPVSSGQPMVTRIVRPEIEVFYQDRPRVVVQPGQSAIVRNPDGSVEIYYLEPAQVIRP